MNETVEWRPSDCPFFLWRAELVMADLSVWSLSNRQDLTVTALWIIHVTVSSTGWLAKLPPDMWFRLIDLNIYAWSYKWYETFACDTHGGHSRYKKGPQRSHRLLECFMSPPPQTSLVTTLPFCRTFNIPFHFTAQSFILLFTLNKLKPQLESLYDSQWVPPPVLVSSPSRESWPVLNYSLTAKEVTIWAPFLTRGRFCHLSVINGSNKIFICIMALSFVIM
jgi:hypothetical protein